MRTQPGSVDHANVAQMPVREAKDEHEHDEVIVGPEDDGQVITRVQVAEHKQGHHGAAQDGEQQRDSPRLGGWLS